MSSVVDYVGRTVDVLAFYGAKPRGEVSLAQTLVPTGERGSVCTGVQKLSQRWLLEFLTGTGTMPYLPDRGSDFMLDLWQGQLRTTIDARQSFFIAARQVQQNLQAEEDDDMQDDERYGSVTLLAIVVNGDQLTLRLELRSLAGTSRQVILPIPVRAGG